MTLIVTAMETELIKHLNDFKLVEEAPFHLYEGEINNKKTLVIVSGIGKVNASSATTYALTKFPSITNTVNIGYAGAHKLTVGEIYEVGKVYDNDFDLTKFGYEKNQLPGFDARFLSTINHEGYPLYTADHFREVKVEDNPHLVDMEGCAIIRVSKRFKRPLRIFKLVTDLLEKDDQIANYNDNEADFGKLIAEFLKNNI